jgi:hypothetical protein
VPLHGLTMLCKTEDLKDSLLFWGNRVLTGPLFQCFNQGEVELWEIRSRKVKATIVFKFAYDEPTWTGCTWNALDLHFKE